MCVAELQAAVSFHSYPASSAQHSEGLLASGARLPLYIHRHAERRRPGAGTHKHTYKPEHSGRVLTAAPPPDRRAMPPWGCLSHVCLGQCDVLTGVSLSCVLSTGRRTASTVWARCRWSSCLPTWRRTSSAASSGSTTQPGCVCFTLRPYSPSQEKIPLLLRLLTREKGGRALLVWACDLHRGRIFPAGSDLFVSARLPPAQSVTEQQVALERHEQIRQLLLLMRTCCVFRSALL